MKTFGFFRQRMASARRQRGVAMVEFAIGAPILLLLLLAVGEFGRVLLQYNQLMQASRDSARYVAGSAWNRTLGQIDLTGLTTSGKNLAVYGKPTAGGSPAVTGLTTGSVEISPVGAEHIQVTIRHTFLPVIGNVLPTFYGDDIPLNVELVATTVMRVL
ncbi:TadE-like protein [compost metagenome]